MCSPAMRADSSTTPPRAVLMRYNPGFIRLIASSSIRCRVCGVWCQDADDIWNHARVEDRIREAKATGLRNLPRHCAEANAAWLENILVATDPAVWAKLIAFTLTPTLARCRVLHIAARITRSALQIRLRIAATGRWATQIPEAWQRLTSERAYYRIQDTFFGVGVSVNDSFSTGTAAPSSPANVVRYDQDGPIATITMTRPEYRNAQNSAMTYALDDAFYRAASDDSVAVIVLAGDGKHFSAGHDIGTPGRDIDQSFDRRASLWWDHVGRDGADGRFARESEVYLGMCRRWREVPKPTIAKVHGACVAGGLMLAWACDIIIASDDAFFCDPVVRMGIPGVEYFAHPWQMTPRAAKEFLFLGGRMPATRAYELGMVNRVVPAADLDSVTYGIARDIAAMPPFGLSLAKRAVNQCEDLMGLRDGMDSVFGLHHVAHAHNAEVGAGSLAGHDARSMRDGGRAR